MIPCEFAVMDARDVSEAMGNDAKMRQTVSYANSDSVRHRKLIKV